MSYVDNGTGKEMENVNKSKGESEGCIERIGKRPVNETKSIEGEKTYN